jgi:hypothetical protein
MSVEPGQISWMTPDITHTDNDSVASASIWIVGLSVLLGWIPVIGPAIAGYVGGRKAGSPGRGLVAGVIPAILLGVIVGVVLAMFELPVIGTVTGIAVAIWIAIEAIPLLMAAAVGGWVDQERTGPAS